MTKKTPKDYSIPELQEFERTFSIKSHLGQYTDEQRATFREVADKARAEIERRMSEAIDVFLPSNDEL